MNHVTSVRNRKHALRMVQELDAFPKVPESYQETTATGGGSTYLSALLQCALLSVSLRTLTATPAAL